MEINVKRDRLMYLRDVLQETKTQEKLSEAIVPDSFPDIAHIVDSHAAPVLCSKDCRQGSVTVSAAIKGGILYRPEGEDQLRCLDFYIPAECKFEHEMLTEQSQIICSLRIKSVEGKLINSRKAMLRVELSYRVNAFEADELTIPVVSDVPEELQLRNQEYDFVLPLETSEKSFMIGELLDLPASLPAAQIYKYHCTPEITDQRMIGNRGIFKGSVACKLLYLGSDHKLHTFLQQLPFSQYCEFAGDYEEETVKLYPAITGFDLEVDRSGNMSRLPVSIHMLVQAVVIGKKRVMISDDAYVTAGKLRTEWNECAINTSIDHVQNVVSMREMIPGSLRDVLDYDIYMDFPSVRRSGDQAEVVVSATPHILGLDENNSIVGYKAKLTKNHPFALASAGMCSAETTAEGPMYITPTANGTEIRMDTGVVMDCSVNQSIRYLDSAVFDAEDDAAAESALIVRRFIKGCSLWEIAKAYGAKTETVKQANQLSSEQIEDNTILLIPVG